MLMCLCLSRVSPVVSLDSVGSTLLAMRAGCRRGSGSSKHLLVLQSRLPLHHAHTDVFPRLLPPDVSENNWPSSCSEGVENKPKKPPAEKTAQERCVLFTQRKHTVTCSNNTIVARLLAQHQGGSSNSSQHCWEQCFVHGTTGVVCAAAAPLTLTHIPPTPQQFSRMPPPTTAQSNTGGKRPLRIATFSLVTATFSLQYSYE